MTFSEIINHPYVKDNYLPQADRMRQKIRFALLTGDDNADCYVFINEDGFIYEERFAEMPDDTIPNMVTGLRVNEILSDKWEFVDETGKSMKDAINLKYPPADKTGDLF